MPRRRRRRMTGKRGAAGAQGSFGVPGIVAHLSEARAQLVAQRAALDEQISALDKAVVAMGAARPAAPSRLRRPFGRPAGRRGGRRGRRAGSLKDHIARVLKSAKGALAVRDITAGVRKAGYASRNRTLAKSVGTALTQMPEVVKVRRGMFRAK